MFIVSVSTCKEYMMQTHTKRLIALMEKGRYSEAVQQLHMLSPKELEEWRYCYIAGECYRMMHKLEFARFYLFQAYSNKRENTEIAHSLGMVYEEMGRYDEAKVLFEETVAHEPERVPLYHRLGVCYMREGNISEAINWFIKGIEQITMLYRRNFLSLEHIMGKKYRKSSIRFEYLFSRGMIDDSLDLEFFKAVFLHDIGLCYQEMGDFKRAQEWFLRSIESIPEGVLFDDPFVYLEDMSNQDSGRNNGAICNSFDEENSWM